MHQCFSQRFLCTDVVPTETKKLSKDHPQGLGLGVERRRVAEIELGILMFADPCGEAALQAHEEGKGRVTLTDDRSGLLTPFESLVGVVEMVHSESCANQGPAVVRAAQVNRNSEVFGCEFILDVQQRLRQPQPEVH